MESTAPAKKKARPRDAAATKALILDCAVREFAERGHDGARIERIVTPPASTSASRTSTMAARSSRSLP